MSFDINKPYTTRVGRKAWAVRSPEPFAIGSTYGRFIGWVESSSWVGEVRRRDPTYWTDDGRILLGDEAFDLVNIPDRRTVKMHINILADGAAYGSTARTKSLTGNTIACIEREISFEVGEGL